MGRAARAREGLTGESMTVTASAPKLDDAVLERVAQETRRMGVAERVIYWDKRQAAQVWVGPDGQPLGDADIDFEILPSGRSIVKRPDGSRLVPSPEIILCPNDPKHGPMMINGAGSLLMCGARKQGAVCTGTQPVSA